MRNLRIATGAALMLALTLAGCGQKTETATSQSASDSLLAASPVEPPQGNMTPAEDYQQQQQTPETTAPPTTPATTKPKTTTKPAAKPAAPPSNPGVSIPAGTALKVAVNAQITSETAQPGDAWQGTIAEPLVIGTAAPIPAGSVVHGVVKAVKPAQKGDRAMLQLAITSVEVNGTSHTFNATGESIEAGSTRARNVGAVAGGAAAGALIGKAIGGSGKGALIGALAGGAASGAAVAASKGYQVVVKEGAQISFSVDVAVTMK
jgi:hypothetical protein